MLARATQQRREELGRLLVDIAERRIAASGLRSLTARELAAEAGCSIGAIYNAFADMDALAAAVNSRTANRLELAVTDAFAQPGTSDDPKTQLVLLGQTYLSFVITNPRLWSAIFELRPSDGALSEKQASENARLMEHVVQPLRLLMPELTQTRRQLMARGLFSAVHGIVMLGQQGRFMAARRDEIADQIDFVVESVCDGINLRRIP